MEVGEQRDGEALMVLEGLVAEGAVDRDADCAPASSNCGSTSW
jgi:hypothetical protein